MLELSAGTLQLRLAPEIGGSVARFDMLRGGDRLAIFRPAPPDASHVLQAASFPVVPFANRIREGRFQFRGRTIALPPNMRGEALPLHGQGWIHPWHVAACTAHAAELVFEHRAGDWPWRYEARQSLSLSAEALEILLTCRNLSDEDMPCGLGQHPYFPCNGQTVLDMEVDAVWTIDAKVLPLDRVAAQGRYSVARRPICGADLDNGYDGWRGLADITWPDRKLACRLQADATRFQIYAPPGGGFFVAEPVTNANAALNAPEREWPGLGIGVLAPGAEMALRVRIAINASET